MTSLFDVIVTNVQAIADGPMRKAWLADLLTTQPAKALAPALDELCQRSEQASPVARQVLVTVVLVLTDPAYEAEVQALRDEAEGQALLSLARLLRRPVTPDHKHVKIDEDRIPDYVPGRALTLGERKSLARRPSRQHFDKLLKDPHPDVVRMLLANPKLTEEDVLRLATKRPALRDVLVEVARSARWGERPRVRLSLVLNPSTPLEIAVPMVSLLVRSELRLVLEMTELPNAVRSAAREQLVRRPPSPDDGDDDPVLQ